jgi:hypothetical protein
MRVNKGWLEYFVYWISQTRLRNMILELRHRGKTWMSWLKHITKVRPWDPSCVLVYARGCALLVFIYVYDVKKILVDALGTLRTTGIHSL